MTPALAREFDIAPKLQGVLVERVARDSAAAEAGLEPGDVIVEVNRHPITSVEQLNRYMNESNYDSTVLFVNRAGHTRYVVIASK